MVTTWFKDYSYCLINVVTIELPELSTLVFDRTAFNLTHDAEFSCFLLLILDLDVDLPKLQNLRLEVNAFKHLQSLNLIGR